VEIYGRHKSIYQEYFALPKSKREAFKVKNSAFITAHKYLTGVLNGRTSIPAKVWKVECEKLLSERYWLCEKYYSLKDDAKTWKPYDLGLKSYA